MPTFKSDNAAKIHQHLHSHLPSDPALRVKALESLVVERGLVASKSIDCLGRSIFRTYRTHARCACRCPCMDADSDFKARLLGRRRPSDNRIRF